MIKTKEILLGLVVGFIAYYLYVTIIGGVVAYLPINYQNLTEGMSKEQARFAIEAYFVVEGFLAALVMALIVYVVRLIFKFKASKLFIKLSMVSFLATYIIPFYGSVGILLQWHFFFGIVIPALLLWFSLIAPVTKD